MNHLELHIIQSVPVTCLNRDDLNSPKTAVFGGVQRARVSSQSWKRAIRSLAKELSPERFKGQRTRLLYEPLLNAMVEERVAEAKATEASKKIVDELVKIDEKSKEIVKSKTLYFISPLECATIAKAFKETGDIKKSIKAVKGKHLVDAADIALFGRMVASDHSLTVEAASMFSHALSTHRSDNEIDFFSAVDDGKAEDAEDAGAGITGTLEFNSSTYYRFAALNLDMLADAEHLGALTLEERKNVVSTFVEATIKAVPSARKNTMNGNTLPVYVLGVCRAKGHPIQLINAFESPVKSSQGFTAKSVDLLKGEYAKLKDTWGVEAVFEKAIPDIDFKKFIDGMVDHVI